MNCTICTRPIILIPSARERAAKFGGTANDYTSLFTTHPQCALDKRRKETDLLMERMNTRSHQWTEQGFCKLCHNVHRTDFRQNDICPTRIKLNC